MAFNLKEDTMFEESTNSRLEGYKRAEIDARRRHESDERERLYGSDI